MKQQGLLIILHLVFVISQVGAQNLGPDAEEDVPNFQPSLAVVIGILSIMFLLTFLLLVYAKFCHTNRGVSILLINNRHSIGSQLARSASGLSGIDKKVIQSLPFFKFSSLRGSRGGLECAVCLSKFEDIEVLRLLPKCKHAFHIGCVDRWLERHSSCPMCRCNVSAEDGANFVGSESLRFLRGESEVQEDSGIELFVHREEDHHGSSRFSIGSSFRRIENGNHGNEDQKVVVQDQDQDHQDEEALLRKLNHRVKNHHSSRFGRSFRSITEKSGGNDHDHDQKQGQEGDDDQKVFHKLNHKIVMSDVMLKNRWSNVSSSDLMFLNSEMLKGTSSERFNESGSSTNDQFLDTTSARKDELILKIKHDLERKVLLETKIRSSNSNQVLPMRKPDPSEKRSVSDITSISRFRDQRVKSRVIGESSSIDQNNLKEARIRRLWLPIARKTAEWFADREKRSQQLKNSTQPETTLDV